MTIFDIDKYPISDDLNEEYYYQKFLEERTAHLKLQALLMSIKLQIQAYEAEPYTAEDD